jgi:PAS domain S-box-containing protein
MSSEKRKIGIQFIDKAPWGTHFCLFYQTKQDLIDVLVPYLKEGLENNEYCLWVTSEPLHPKEAKKTMRSQIKNFDSYIKKNQIDIISYSEWYLANNEFKSERVLNGWIEKCNSARAQGFEGLRLTGNTFWLEKKDWKSFMDYEGDVNSVIIANKMIVLCTYSLDKCGSYEILDVIRNHEFAIIRYKGTNYDLIERKGVEQHIKVSEEKYQLLVKNAQEGILTIDENANITLVNDKMATLLGYSVDEMMGKCFFNFMDEEWAKIAQKDLERRKQGIKEQHDFEFVRKDGNKVFTIVETSPIIDLNGNYVGAMKFITDITVRKKIEQNLRLHSEIMKNMAEGVFLIRVKDLTIVYTNPKIEKMFGYDTGEMIGKHISIANAPIDKDPDEIAGEIVEILKKNGEWHGEIKNIKKDGTPFWCYANVSIFESPEHGMVFIAVHSDITKSKEIEDRLKESEIIYRNAYEQVDFYKDLFTHDISNVIQNVSSAAELLLLSQNKAEFLNKSNEYLNLIKEQASMGSKLISNIRKVSEIPDSSDSFKSIEIYHILENAINFIRKSYLEKIVKIDVESPIKKIHIKGNELILDVFENILVNAVKYNKNLIIEITIKISEIIKNKSKSVKIEFLDNGIGIKDAQKKQIFEGISKRKERGHGMGLGLLLVKKIVKSFNGEITVEDKIKGDPSKGSNFIVIIPELP